MDYCVTWGEFIKLMEDGCGLSKRSENRYSISDMQNMVNTVLKNHFDTMYNKSVSESLSHKFF